jgi:hypothetical protein
MENILQERALATIDGHVMITDLDTGEVLLDKHNAINFINMAVSLASLLANKLDDEERGYFITHMAFGNGGSTVDTTGTVQYRAPNVSTADGQFGKLHRETYIKSVANLDEHNKIQVEKFQGQVFSDVVVTSTLGFGEPDDQEIIDNSSTFEGDFVFDEIGLVTETGSFLTHIVFHPIEKSANRKIQVVYTLRIRAGS